MEVRPTGTITRDTLWKASMASTIPGYMPIKPEFIGAYSPTTDLPAVISKHRMPESQVKRVSVKFDCGKAITITLSRNDGVMPGNW